MIEAIGITGIALLFGWTWLSFRAHAAALQQLHDTTAELIKNARSAKVS